MRRRTKLTESKLNRIIKEAIKKVVKESVITNNREQLKQNYEGYRQRMIKQGQTPQSPYDYLHSDELGGL